MAETAFHTSEAAAKRRADAGTFRRVFEDNPDGAAVLEALEKMFCRKIWHPGGLEGARQTDYANGQFSVINFINAQLNLAHGAGDPNDDGGS